MAHLPERWKRPFTMYGPMLMLLLVGLSTSGCHFSEPITTRHDVPIDENILGRWQSRKSHLNLLILKYSDTEYLIRKVNTGPGKSNDTEPYIEYFRGYPFEIAGTRYIQLQILGIQEDKKSSHIKVNIDDPYIVTYYRIEGDTMKTWFLDIPLKGDEKSLLESLRHKPMTPASDPNVFFEGPVFRRLERLSYRRASADQR